jgi:hypothetical protein
MEATHVTTPDWISWLARWNCEQLERIDPTLESRLRSAGVTVENILRERGVTAEVGAFGVAGLSGRYGGATHGDRIPSWQGAAAFIPRISQSFEWLSAATP